MCGQYNVRAIAGDNTEQNTKETHPVPEYILKISDPVGNRKWPAGLEGRDSAEHATTTGEKCIFFLLILS